MIKLIDRLKLNIKLTFESFCLIYFELLKIVRYWFFIRMDTKAIYRRVKKQIIEFKKKLWK